MGGNVKEKFTYKANNKKFNEFFLDGVIDADEARDILKRKNNDLDNIFKIGKIELGKLKKILNSSSLNSSILKEDDIKKLTKIANKDYRVLKTFGPGTTKVASEANAIGGLYDNSKSLDGLDKLENFSSKDIIDFAAIVKAESMGESRRGQIGVAFVILNRMKYRKKSLNKIIYEKNQFSPMMDGSFLKKRKKINFSDKQFIIDIISGKYANPIGEATFFQTKQAERKYSNWQKNNPKLKIVATIGNHIFRKEV